MTLELVKSATFAIDVGAIEAKREAFAALVCDSPSGYEAVRLAIAECRDTRVAIEGRRKELKADALEYGRQVDSVAKQLTSIVESIEDPLRWKKAAADEAKAKAKAERARAEQARVEAEEIKARQAEIAAGIAARLEAVKPDVDKMREFAAMLRGLPTPTVRSDEATDVAILALARVAEAASIVEMWIASC